MEELHKKIHSNIDFFIYLNKNNKGQRYISKVTINNKEIEQEAKELNTLGFSKPQITTKQKAKSKRDILSFSKVLKLYKQYQSGSSLESIAKANGLSRYVVYRLFRAIKK